MNKFKKTAESGNNEVVKMCKAVDWDIDLVLDDDYSVYDGIITTRKGSYLAEFKHRAKKYDTMMMEDKKVRSIFQIFKANPDKYIGVVYINTFDDGTALVWRITNEFLRTVEKKVMSCPRTTSGYKGRKDKLVYLLPTDKAIKIKY